MKTIEEVREYFKNDRYAALTGCEIEEIGEHYAKASLKLSDNHKNAVGNVMGGVYFTLADFVFAVATNWQEPEVVSLNSSITYHAPLKGETMIATAECIKDGRNTCYYEINITDENGKLLVSCNITGFKSRIPSKS